MNSIEYNNKKEELKRVRQELFDVRMRLEINKKDDKKYNIWLGALKNKRREMAIIKSEIATYENENGIKKK